MSFNDLRISVQQELQSFKSLPPKEVGPALKIGDQAPVSEEIQFPSDKPMIIVFLRNCGDPFAEKTFQHLTALSNRHHQDVDFVAVSHSTRDATDKWVIEVGGEWETRVLVDPERDLYAQWGLGTSSAWHALSPRAIYSTYRLGRDEGIWNRAAESGSRWQTAGAFAVDAEGYVRWASVAKVADEVPDLDEALRVLKAPVQAQAQA